MRMKTTLTVCVLGLLLSMGVACRKSTGARNFSFNFDGKEENAIAIALKMHDAICQELEKRGFKKLTMSELSKYVHSKVKEDAAIAGREQTPELQGGGSRVLVAW